MTKREKKKATNECLFCGSRFCYERVVSANPDYTYDEVACNKHVKTLHHHSDEILPGVLRHFISSTAIQKRGQPFR